MITMEKETYRPHPVSTEGVRLSEEIEQLAERIAENVHEVWAAARMAEGWTWGEQRDDTRKLHPCLIPYDQLPESEKEYDRKTALETLKLVQKLGFTIQRSKA